MPLQSTDQNYKEYLMKNRGIDSTQFNLDDEGNVVPRTIEQPVLNDSEKPIIDPSNLPNAKPQTSIGGTLVHGALNSALPTAAGLGVAGLTSLALAPETGGLSLLGLLGTGIAGAAGGAGASYLQDKVLPDSFKQQLSQEQQDNPISAFVGRNIPQALAFNPYTGAKNLVQAISTGGESVSKGFAKSVIANMGISGGIDTAQQLASGQPFSVGQLGESVGTAALFNQPNALGKRLMFEPSHQQVDQQVQGEPAIPKTVEQIMQEQLVPDEEHSRSLGDTGIENTQDVRNKNDKIVGVGKPGSKIADYADGDFHGNVIDQTGIGNEGDITKAFNSTEDKAKAESQKRADDFELAKQELDRENAIQDQKNKIELDRQKNAQDASDNAARALELKKVLEDNQTQRSSGLGVGLENHEVSVPKPGYEVQPDYTGNVEHDNNVVANDSDLVERQLEARLGGDKASSIKYQDESVQQLTTKNKEESAFLYRNATPQYKKAVQQLMVKRGISLHEAVNLVNPQTGKEVLGSSNATTREVTLNNNKAEVDTPIHEVSHQFLDDLSKSSDPTDQKLARDAQVIFSGHKKGAEEGTAIDQGLRGANRLATSLEGTPIERARGWAKDFMSRWKYNLGLHSDEDVSRHLSQRIVTDAPSFGFENKVLPTTQNEDRQKYDNLVTQFKAEKDEPSRLAIQQQMEDIKNRNGGMPPTKYQDESAYGGNTEKRQKFVNEVYNKIWNEHVKPKEGNPFRDETSSIESKQDHYINTMKGILGSRDLLKLSKVEPSLHSDLSGNSNYSYGKLNTREENKPITALHESLHLANSVNDGQRNSLINSAIKSGNVSDADIQRNALILERINPNYINENVHNFISNNYNPKHEGIIRERALSHILNEYSSRLSDGTLPKDSIEHAYVKDLVTKVYGEKYANFLENESQNAEYLPKYDSKNKTYYQDESALFTSKDKSLGITRSAIDDIMKKDGPEAVTVAKAFSKYYMTRPEIAARYKKPVYDAAKGMSEESQDRVEQALLDGRTSNSNQVDTLTSDKEKNLYNVMRDTLDLIPKDRNEANMPVRAFNDKGESYLRQAKSDPNYMYNQLSPKVIESLSANRNSEESLGYKKAFLEHQAAYGTKPEQAKAMWDNMTKVYDKGSSSQDHFRGLDVEQGAGLPPELMRPGLFRNFDRYIGRVSSARAFHDTIESNPEVASKLGYKTTPWDKPLPESDFHSPRVNEVLKHIKGEQFDPEEAKVKGWNRVATSGMLGYLTNIHILASSAAKAISKFRPNEVAEAITKSIMNFHTGVEHALENGSLTQKRRIFSDLLNAHSTTLERLNSLADGISRLNGRGVTDYISKGLLQASGEHLVRTRIPMAQGGDKDAIRLMNHIDPDFSPTKKYDEKEIQRLASNFGSLIHGAHDARTMPAWMLHETALQPFFSLASWSIGQTNDFMKHVVTPATNDHNYTPLLMSTLGAGLGGYIIKELREGVSNKKSPIPSFNEIANSPRGVSGNLPLVGYNLAAMASFAGYAGILSTGVKTLFDGAYKNAPQGATFPLDEVAGNVVHIANNAYAALMNTSDPKEYVKIGTKAIADILRENIQTARIASSWGDEAGLLGSDRQYKKKLNVEEDDLRRYKTTAGLPITDESSAGSDNPYYQENRKAFKHTLDLKEAAKQVPELVKQAMNEATIDGHLNQEILREKLKALKGSSYPSMPNPDNAPLQFYNYLSFLKKSKGDDYAQQHLIEYMKNNEIGKTRSSLIPTL